jgi:hypothetical protein
MVGREYPPLKVTLSVPDEVNGLFATLNPVGIVSPTLVITVTALEEE